MYPKLIALSLASFLVFLFTVWIYQGRHVQSYSWLDVKPLVQGNIGLASKMVQHALVTPCKMLGVFMLCKRGIFSIFQHIHLYLFLTYKKLANTASEETIIRCMKIKQKIMARNCNQKTIAWFQSCTLKWFFEDTFVGLFMILFIVKNI